MEEKDIGLGDRAVLFSLGKYLLDLKEIRMEITINYSQLMKNCDRMLVVWIS